MTENIHTAINAIIQEVGYVKKERSGGLNYSFAGEAALIAAIRPSMVGHGVYMYVLNINDIQREQYTTAKGTAMVNTIINAMVRFVHAPSATNIDVAATGEGSDAGDKSANKAMTGLFKYAIRQTFMIETGDDPDKNASEEGGKRTSSKQASNGKISRTDGALLQAMVNHKLADNTSEAKNMMLKCLWPTSTLDKFLTWATVYRGWRDTGLEVDDAAEKTNNGERP
jgi:hypothetical protein